MGGLVTKSVLVGAGFALGLLAVTVLAVTVGTVKTWTTGETLTAADLNSTITSLKTALEAIPNWTKSGTAAVYTDGNVGIGTTTPTRPLHVAGAGDTHAKVESVSGLGVAGIQLKNSQLTNEDWFIQTDSNQPSGGGLAFHDVQRTAYRMVINNVGNVGIGTTTPGANLHVKGDIRSEALPSANKNATFWLNSTSGKFWSVWLDGGDNDKLKFGYEIGVNAVTFDRSGNVGIGTATPGYPLTMGSGAYVTTGGAWTNASSREYKENLEDLTAEEALAAVMALEPQKFNYKSEKRDCTVAKNRKPSPPPSPFHPPAGGFQGEGVPSPRRDPPSSAHNSRRMTHDPRPLTLDPCSPDQYIGFIAEDVPDLVATNDRKGLSAMDLVAVLTKVVQHQQDEIEALKGKIETLGRK